MIADDAGGEEDAEGACVDNEGSRTELRCSGIEIDVGSVDRGGASAEGAAVVTAAAVGDADGMKDALCTFRSSRSASTSSTAI